MATIWDLILPVGLAALVVHQIFRRYEACHVGLQLALLIIPPLLATSWVLHESGVDSDLTFARAVVVAYPTFVTILVTSVVAYRLSPFHPLARYPGPIACKITKFRMAFKCLPGHQQHYIKSLHERYGDIVRTGPNELSVRDPTVVPALTGTSGAPKGPHLAGRLLQNANLPLLAIQDTEVHLQRRRAWNRGLSPAAIKGYEELITTRVRQLVNHLEHQGGKADLRHWFDAFTYDVMSDMVFGGGSELMGGEKENNFWSILEEALAPSTFLGHVPWLGYYLSYIPPAVEPVNIILARCRELAEKRLKQGSVMSDLFHYLNNEDLPDKEAPPMEHLAEDGVLAIIGGADTVASAFASMFACLIRNPETLAKLQDEVDRFYPPGEDALDTKHHREMHYLNAVINETLRVYPPGAGCTQRRVADDGNGIVAGSKFFPPGTNIWIHAFSMHRDAKNFSPDPERFRPERWLDNNGASRSSSPRLDVKSENAASPFTDAKSPTHVHNTAAFYPFSYGPMNCAGKNLAWQEMRTVVCALVQRFRIRATEGWEFREYDEEYKDYFMATRGPVRVDLEGFEPALLE